MSFLVDVTMAYVYLCFVTAHYSVFAVTHSWQVGLIVAQETLLIVLFLARRRTQLVSQQPKDWIAAGVGTFGPLMLRPTGVGPVSTVLQMVGIGVSMASLLSLRRSFGLVAAWRKTVTGGMYSVVRHPQYAGHLLLLFGYFVASPTLWNAAVLGVTLAAMVVRIGAEETLLCGASAEYCDYYARVQWRLMPGVF